MTIKYRKFDTQTKIIDIFPMRPAKKTTLKQLRTIPGVGESIAMDLWDLGIRSVADLRRKNPQRLYEEHCRRKGTRVDRCVLYVFRCAVYYASVKKPKSELMFWWNWKDRKE